MKCMENKETEIFHVFILSFNKFIHFPSFLGSSWTYLDFFFLSLLATLETVQFFSFFLSGVSFMDKHLLQCMNDKTHPSV